MKMSLSKKSLAIHSGLILISALLVAFFLPANDEKDCSDLSPRENCGAPLLIDNPPHSNELSVNKSMLSVEPEPLPVVEGRHVIPESVGSTEPEMPEPSHEMTEEIVMEESADTDGMVLEEQSAERSQQEEYELEESSGHWAVDKESFYIDLFSEEESLAGFVLSEVSCKSSRCKLSFLVAESTQKDEITNKLVERLLTESNELKVSIDQNGAEGETVLYIQNL